MTRSTKATLLSLIMAALALRAAPAPATNIGAFILGSVTNTGCASGAFRFDATLAIADPGTYTVRTFADVGATRYMDEIAGLGTQSGGSARTWGLFDINSGGTKTGTWPLPSGQPVVVRSVLRDADAKPLWETRSTISCLSSTLLASSNGPIFQLAQNGGFENAGSNAKRALDWKGGRRVCTDDPMVHVNSGSCALQLKKGKLRQEYATDPIAGPGDELRLSAFVQGTALESGSTMQMTVFFPTLPAANVTANIPAGDYQYQEITSSPLAITEAPVRVSLQVRKGGKGDLLIDDLRLLSVANASE